MFTTYEEALGWIHSRLRLGIKPGLKRMEWMMERLEHPHDKINAIHVAGTNGKGSTVCYLRNMLECAGYNVGTFTSPFFEVFNERISVNGHPIADEEIVRLANIIYPLAVELESTEWGSPTEFEIITAMAFYYFGNQEDVDIVVFETGLGGRLDSTNIINPLLTVITNIGYDHMNLLGETLPEIAFEKAGIIKEGVPLVSSVEQEEAIKVIMDRATSLQSQVYCLDLDYHITNKRPIAYGEEFSIRTPTNTFQELIITMKGEHQIKNAALSLMAISVLQQQHDFIIKETHIREGLKRARWIGRFETLCDRPTIIIDGAHNPEGINSLVNTINTRYNDRKVHIIFCALKDKKLSDMIIPLETVAESLSFTSFDFPRVSSAKELFDVSTFEKKDFDEDWKSCITRKMKSVTNDEILIVTGSLYFLSEVRPFIVEECKNI
ncbi:bifunctional folylpolyglutamate synthase/dihydrofolate synthase [Bacillus luteolus]|uniref:tetrahydrofolate synthase n=1 Tax=Litchfieldia luteola TaxID=682179 RepID=A0ABR9QI52_9BACI|nr:folylpolyglutamate synthase/dihydrofolate synthase family protein [Cytobacillus luteolus]MBE4908165.1 bifunctional folylpolyglutamate synthase/dihydrofolate synthase [Cytobacillus luteolus]MBP1942950.1 dihydrofolate synthase/folylpolyglutamate synthase [Cytobacillus luteolus]